MTFKNCTIAFLFFVPAALLPAPACSSAQSLGKVARQYRKEREARRKKGEVPVKVFTNDDIVRMFPPEKSASSENNAAIPAVPHTPRSEKAIAPGPSEATGGKASAGSSAPKPAKAEEGVKSKEYWQARFKAARAALSQAKEDQTLVEDELRLLQVQQARTLDPDRSRKLNTQIDKSTIELQAKRAATANAQAALDETEKEFKKSGAPKDWISNATGSH